MLNAAAVQTPTRQPSVVKVHYKELCVLQAAVAPV